MPPREPPFQELLATVKANRSDVRVSSGVSFSKLSLRRKSNGKMELLGLGTGGGVHQTLLGGTVSERGCVLHRQLEPLSSSSSSTALSLQAERQRSSAVGGMTHMSMAPSGVVYLGGGDQVLRVDEDGNVDSPMKIGHTVLDVQVCPADDSLIAVSAMQGIIILRDSRLIYQSEDNGKDVLCGIPSFITQEELERFTGFWWSPNRTRLLYERVEEEDVERVVVSTRQPPMKYPLAGTTNARSSLRMLIVNEDEVEDRPLRFDLRTRFPWFEYLSRAGFMADGEAVWIVLLDREQKREALVIIPGHEFMGITKSERSTIQEVTVVHDSSSAYWINSHNLTCSLSLPNSQWSLLHGVEGDKGVSLLLLSSHSHPFLITKPYLVVNKVGGVFVDEKRQLVYFFAHHSSPVEINFCVASLNSNRPGLSQLTEGDLSCRMDRAMRSAALQMDSSFVVWMSSLRVPPCCVVYSLIHSNDCLLPTSQRLCVVEHSSSSMSCIPSPRLDCPRLLYYLSPTTGLTHYALVHTPQGEGPFPIVHFIYGGPGVQLVRNDWTAWTTLHKFVSLGYAAIVVDGRGSDNRGKEWEAAIKHGLGEAELSDQVEGLHAVISMAGEGTLDAGRVAVHGWSYGGYMSVLAIAHHPNVYRCAVAGGTVVDWSLYDTAYTERYLGLSIPSYASSNLERVVKALPDETGRLMLAHGLQDENVHFRHVENLIDLLIKNGKPYSLQLFPSERHGLRSLEASAHFDASMFSFISAALND